MAHTHPHSHDHGNRHTPADYNRVFAIGVALNVIYIVAATGVVINTATALLFLSGRKKDLNIRGAFLHMAADAGVSAGVVVAGVVIRKAELPARMIDLGLEAPELGAVSLAAQTVLRPRNIV